MLASVIWFADGLPTGTVFLGVHTVAGKEVTGLQDSRGADNQCLPVPPRFVGHHISKLRNIIVAVAVPQIHEPTPPSVSQALC